MFPAAKLLVGQKCIILRYHPGLEPESERLVNGMTASSYSSAHKYTLGRLRAWTPTADIHLTDADAGLHGCEYVNHPNNAGI